MALILYNLLFLNLLSSIEIKEVFVKYRVNAKALFGMMTHTIEARNDSVKSELYIEEGELKGKVIIKSGFFVSGNTRRDRDVSEILETDRFPLIIFEPLGVDTTLIKDAMKRERGELKIKGKLTVRDITKTYVFNINYEKSGKDEYIIKVKSKGKFTDFGIEPPRIKGLGAVGKVITYAPDEIFFIGFAKIKLKNEK